MSKKQQRHGDIDLADRSKNRKMKNKVDLEYDDDDDDDGVSSVSSSTGHDEASLSTPLSRSHGCTDVLCTILFFVFILAFVALSVFAFINGKPDELINPHDTNGLTCGYEDSVRTKPYLLFFDITRCISIKSAITGCPTRQLCVEACPNETLYSAIPKHKVEIGEKFCTPDGTDCPKYVLASKPVYGRCIPEVLAKAFDVSNLVIETLDPDTGKNVTIQYTDTTSNKATNLTLSILRDGIRYISDLLDLKRVFEYAYEDFQKSIWLIVAGLVIGMILSFIWILLFRFFIKPLFYLSVLIVLGLLGFGAYFCFNYYRNLKSKEAPSVRDPDFTLTLEKALDLKYLESLQETWLALSIILLFILAVLALVLIFLRNRIRLSVELIKESSKAVVSIPTSLFWPILPFVLQLSVIIYCIFTALYLASAGVPLYKIALNSNTTTNLTSFQNGTFSIGDFCDPKTFNTEYAHTDYACIFYKFGFNNTYPKFLQDNSLTSKFDLAYAGIVDFLDKYQWLPQFYVAFMFFWLMSFIIGLSEMTLAGAFGGWYWTRFSNADSKRSNSCLVFPLGASLLRALFFHLGTLAFGSLLIAIVKIIRTILEYIDSKLKSVSNQNRLIKFILKCLMCCLWCYEKFIKFLNHNAYIITAIYGSNFCMSAQKAFKIILNNIIHVTVIDKITNFMLFLSKFAITMSVGVLAFYFFTKQIPIDSIKAFAPDLHYYFLPIFVILFGVYVITKVFFDVFEICVDTLFLCAMIDMDLNNGSAKRKYFMSTNMRKILGVKNK